MSKKGIALVLVALALGVFLGFFFLLDSNDLTGLVVLENETTGNETVVLTDDADVVVEPSVTITNTSSETVSDPSGEMGIQDFAPTDFGIQDIGNATQCGDVRGNITLESNVSSTNTCFDVNGSNIVINCAGYKINYSTGTGVGYAIYAQNKTNVTVKNCLVYEGNVSTGQRFGIYLLNVSNGTVHNNTVRTYSLGQATGIIVPQNINTTVSNNTIAVYGGDGVYSDTSTEVRIRGNNVTVYGDTYAVGLYTFANLTTVYGNTLSGNGSGAGVFVGSNAVSSILVEENIITFNNTNANGILIDINSANNIFLNNNITVLLGMEISDVSEDGSLNYLIYNNSLGEIVWTNNTNGGFLEDMEVNGTIGLGINLFIGNGTAALNTSAFHRASSKINSTANISLFGLSFVSVSKVFRVENYSTNSTEIQTAGSDCLLNTSCTQISFGSNTYVFNTSFFSSFTLNGSTDNLAPNTTLVIFNATTSQNKTSDYLDCWARGNDTEQTTFTAAWTLFRNNQNFRSGSISITNNTLTNITRVAPNDTQIEDSWICQVYMDDGIAAETDYTNVTASSSLNGYACGDLVESSDTLIETMANCTENGLNISASNIDFSCGNFVINGSGKSNGYYGIFVPSSYSNVTLRNCVINNFSYGIYSRGNDLNITENTIYNTTYGVFLDHTQNNSLQFNIIYNATNSSIYLNYSLADNVTANNISFSTYGITVVGNRSNLSLNTIFNTTYGIYVNGSSHHTITSNKIENTTHGVFFYLSNMTSTNVTLLFNNLTLNRNAINFTGANSLIRDNRIYNNTEGIVLLNATNTTISFNRIYNQSSAGIYVDNGLYVSGGVSYNNITFNNLTYNLYGVFTYSPDATLASTVVTNFSYNNLQNNTNSTIYWDSSSTLLAENNWWGYGNNCTHIHNSFYQLPATINFNPFLNSTYPGGLVSQCEDFCGMMVFESKNMTGNINDCTSIGINIGSSNLIFNCKGYQITAIQTPATGISSAGRNNVTIRDCFISGFSRAISVTGNPGGNNTLLNNTISVPASAESVGIGLSSSGSSLYNSTINGLSKDNTTGIETSSSGTLEGNNLTNLKRGVLVSSSDRDNIFINNYLSNNSYGYEFQNWEAGNNMTGDQIINHSLAGIYINTSVTGDAVIDDLFHNATFLNNTLDLSIVYGTGSVITFVNSSLNLTKTFVFPGGTSYVKRYVDITVRNSSGSLLEGATVTAYDVDNAIVDSENTSSSGVARLEVTEYYQTGNITYYVTPTNITGTRGNYTQNTTNISLINATFAEVNLTLQRVECGETLNSSFTLSRNYNCAGNAFILGGHGIIVDGNGYNITGTGAGKGINATGVNNIVIKNVLIRNFSSAIGFDRANDSSVVNVTLLNNTKGIEFLRSQSNSVYNSSFINDSTDILINSSLSNASHSIINSSVTPSKISVDATDTALVKWYAFVNTTYNSGLKLANANATGYFNNTLVLEDSQLTASTGFAQLILTEYKVNASGTITYLTPHNVTVLYSSSSGTSVNSTVFNLTQTNTTDVRLSLSLNCVSPNSTLTLYNDTTLCPGTFFGVFKINISNNSVDLTCDNTVIRGSDDAISKIVVAHQHNVTITGCTLKQFAKYGVELTNVTNVSIFNLDINSSNNQNAQGLYCDGSSAVSINSSAFANPTDVNLYYCHNTTIFNNTFNGSVGIRFDGAENASVRNNTFSNDDRSLYFYHPAKNNKVYYNLFYNNGGYFAVDGSSGGSSTNHLNTTSAGYAQGNQWEDYCDKGRDLNSDSFADTNSTGNDDWPYNANHSTKISDPGVVSLVDYGPKIVSCPSSVVIRGSSSAGSSSVASQGSSLPPEPLAPTEDEPPEVAPPSSSDYYSATEAADNLGRQVAVQQHEEAVTRVVVTLENKGTKKMLLFPELSQDLTDSYFIVTRRTLGFEGSFFSKVASLAYSEQPIAGRLLKAEVLNPEQIVLDPGQKIEKVLEIKEGLVAPRNMKIKFTTVGETVFEEGVAAGRKSVTGSAVDVLDDNTVDVYAVIVPESFLGPNSRDLANPLTGAAIVNTPFEDSHNQYYVELEFNRVGDTQGDNSFSEYYGPYLIQANQTLVFAQQLTYDSQVYKGDYSVRTKIYRTGELLSDDNFGVVLGKGASEDIFTFEGLAGNAVAVWQENAGKGPMRLAAVVLSGLILLLVLIFPLKAMIGKGKKRNI